MLPDEIQDEEVLYRGIHPNHTTKGNENTRISSAAFKDSKGNSVDRDGKRDESIIVDVFLERFHKKGLVKITEEICRDNNTNPVAKPLENNPFHGLIIRNNGDLKLKARETKSLREACTKLYFPGEGEAFQD
jgi:hypothetical protein